MKTYVVQLESHDDLASTRDKMSWAKAPRVLLVWSPRRRRLRLSEVDLILLRRHAAALGADVGLVTTQRALRRVAEHAGIRVYRTTAEAQRAALQMTEPSIVPPKFGDFDEKARRSAAYARSLRTRRERQQEAASQRKAPAWISGQAARVAFFSLGVLSVVTLALLFVPSAEIHVKPLEQTQSLTLPVSASPEVESVGLSGAVPARLKSLSLSASDSLPASGSQVVPTTFARGTVKLTNLTEEALKVPIGTVLIAAGELPVRLVTGATVEVPAGQGETVDVGVRALQGGTAGNLAAETPLAFEGPVGLSLSAANAAPLTGGTDTRQRAPTETDRAELYSRMSGSLGQAALEQAKASPDIIFPDTLEVSKTLGEGYSPTSGQPGSMLTLDLDQEFQLYYASTEDLVTLGRAALDASLPPGYEAASDEVIVTSVSEPVTDSEGVTRWDMKVSRKIRAAITPADIISQVRGRSVARARSALASLLVKPAPEIRIQPAWLPLLPLLPFRISVDTGL